MSTWSHKPNSLLEDVQAYAEQIRNSTGSVERPLSLQKYQQHIAEQLKQDPPPEIRLRMTKP